jgi:lipoate-protein ligase A
MILWCDGAHGARENMRRDAALLEDAADGGEPVLRLFTFAPAGITLGRAQDPARELDLERAAADGVEWAVRPTGGRAIFHAREWTFSLATPLGEGDWAATPEAAYARTCALLHGALRALGIPVELSPGSSRLGSPRAPGAPAAPCFASAARHELTLGGRKLAGIAQRAVRGALLQQGSVLLGEGHLRLADYLRLEPELREGVRAALAASASHAGGHLPADAPLESLADALTAELPGVRRVAGAERPARYTATNGSRSR